MSGVSSLPEAAVVTGGSAGIGRAVCEALAAQGRRVVVLDRRPPESLLPDMEFVSVDLTDREATRVAAADVAARYQVSALVNNAGATRPGLTADASMEDLDVVVALHLQAAILLVQAFLPRLAKHGRGRVVNISSRAALGKPERLVYSATKAGMIGLTRTLAMELGSSGVTVNAVAPGPIATALFRDSNPEGAPQTQRIIDSIVVGRLGTPEDVARAVLFFLSPDNGFVTGQVLYVCGGTTLGVGPV